MDELLIKYVLNEVTAEERRRVEDWAAEKEENQQRLAEFQRIFTYGRTTARPVRTDTRQALARLRERYHLPPTRNHLFTIGRVAAVFTALVLAGAGAWLISDSKKTPLVITQTPIRGSAETTQVLQTRPNTKEEPHKNTPDIPATAKTAETTQTLPDGSVVTLQGQSRIDWLPIGKNGPRKLIFSGNGLFNIAPDPARPFIIETPLVNIKVLGTSFKFQSTGDSATVVVYTGTIQVSTNHDSLILQAGEKLAVTTAHLALTSTVDRERADSKQITRLIIAQAAREGLTDKDTLGWLALDSSRFIIDDRSMPDSIQTRYKRKYLLPDGMGYYYGKVKVHGHGYFFEKKELY
jgi:transmembrane sensor